MSLAFTVDEGHQFRHRISWVGTDRMDSGDWSLRSHKSEPWHCNHVASTLLVTGSSSISAKPCKTACIHLWHGKSICFKTRDGAGHLSHPSPSAGVTNSFDQVAKNWDTKKAKNRHNPLSWSGPEALAAAGLYYHSLTTWRLELWIANAAVKNLWKNIPSYLRGKRIRILMKARSLHTCALTTQLPLLHLFELEMIKQC